MNKFWAEMIMQGKAKFSDIKGEARRAGVRALLEQYLAEEKITQEEFNQYISE